MKALLTLAFALTLVPTAKADIYSKAPDPHYIKVSKTAPDLIRFELCEVEQLANCVLIGTRDYTQQELNNLRNTYYAKAGGIVLADAAVATLLVAGAWYIAPAIGASIEFFLFPAHIGTPAGGILGMISGFAGGLVTSAVSYFYITANYLNPFSRFKKGRLIRKQILNNKFVYVNEPMKDLATRLNEVLVQLN